MANYSERAGTDDDSGQKLFSQPMKRQSLNENTENHGG